MKLIPAWRRCMARVLELPDAARADLEAAMRRVDEGFPSLLYRLSRNFGLDGYELDVRCDALFFEFAAIQVADDLADGDCTYLEPASKVGPGVHWILQHYFYRTLLQSSVPPSAIEQSARDLIMVGGAQQLEVRTERWTLAQSLDAARGLNGRQYAAYFRILSAGTPFEDRAVELGHDFGLALHIVTDRMSDDGRWSMLTPAERVELATTARAAVQRSSRLELQALSQPLRWFQTVLDTALAEPGNASRATTP